MAEDNPDYGYMHKVAAFYKVNNESLKATAEYFGITRVKVRKILVTLGVISSDVSDQIIRLREDGLSVKEIADKLHFSVGTVSTYMPYSTVMYNGEKKSMNAIRLMRYRDRIDIAMKKTNHRKESTKMAVTSEDKKVVSHKRKCDEVIRLHLELIDAYEVNNAFDTESFPELGDITETLHRYGEVRHGNHISRDILVPADIQLWALHYVIQKSFGWQNSHLHRFFLSDDRFAELTDNDDIKWATLVGFIFRDTCMDEDAEFWADDYSGGSFNTWLRRKYTGPYTSGNEEESYHYILEKFHYESDGDVSIGERPQNELLERQLISSVITESGESIRDYNEAVLRTRDALARLYEVKGGYFYEPDTRGITDELYYEYDFGDSWTVRITRERDCSDLLDCDRITQEGLDESYDKVRSTYRPVMIAKDGVDLVDDLGGYSMIPCFLRAINNDFTQDNAIFSDRDDAIGWAKSQGWSTRKTALINKL